MSARELAVIFRLALVMILGGAGTFWPQDRAAAQPAGPTLAIVPPRSVIATNGTGQLFAVYDPDGPAGPAVEEYLDPQSLAWSSDLPRLASVLPAGVVRGHQEGEATIAVEDPIHGLTAAARVTIAGALAQDSLITPDGRVRSFLLYVPAGYDPRSPTALVVVFHGGGGSAEGVMHMSQMNAVAHRHNFLVAYPDGTGPFGGTWNAGTCCGDAARFAVDDVGFTRALIQKVRATYAVDPRRVYATGMSNGAMFTHRLACELSDEIAAIAPVAGGLNFGGDFLSCAPSRPVPVMAFHGTTDDNYPYYGGAGPDSRTGVFYASIPQTVADWVARNQIPAGSKTVLSPAGEGPGGMVTCEVHLSPLTRDEVTLCTVNPPVKIKVGGVVYDGGGHAWPGGARGLGPESDIPTPAMSASAMMWDFFRAHPARSDTGR